MTLSWHHIALGFAGFSIATTWLSATAVAESSGGIADFAVRAAGLAAAGISSGYRAAPALMLGMGLLASIPLIALVSFISQLSHARKNQAPNGTGSESADAYSDAAGGMHDVPGPAFVEVIGAQHEQFAILHDMLRIGREDDNDIRIPSSKVHRYHAAIHRQDMSDWWITDFSGTHGNGLLVNGRKCRDARLHDGDVIELGPGRFKFHAGFA